MKQLSFLIAEKIISDRSDKTIYACISILKDEFLNLGFDKITANIMAIDTVKIIMKTLINIKF